MCDEEFGEGAWICELMSDEEKRIAHVECVKCATCHRKINVQEEYTLRGERSEQSSSLCCKTCGQQQRKANLNHLRLSSKQKEILAACILKSNIKIENVLDESNDVLLYLAAEVKCAPKCIINYVRKHMDKQNGVNSSVEKCIDELDELRKRDVFYYKNPPNVYPFGRNSGKEKSSNNLNQLNVLGDVTNSLIK